MGEKVKWGEMVFCFQNCSDLMWEKNIIVIKKNIWNSRPKAENLQTFESVDKSIGTVNGQTKLLEFKLEK